MIIPGVYKHFKGKLYRLLFTARDTHANPKDCDLLVVYMSMEDGQIWTRKASDWEKLVEWPGGRMKHRFVRWVP